MTEFTGSQKYMLDYLLLELDYVQGTIGIEYGQLLDEKKLTMSTHRLEKKLNCFSNRIHLSSSFSQSLFLNSNTYQFYIPAI